MSDAKPKGLSGKRLTNLDPEFRAYGLKPTAFSLIEVVAAVGIFAIGMIAVLGLYAPVTKSVSNSAEAETAARVAASVSSRLQALPFLTVAGLLKTSAELQANDANPGYNPADGKDTKVMFATPAGEAGSYDATKKAWIAATGIAIPDRDKFFEIALVRNDALSPAANDDTAAFLAFNVRVRWPVFRPGATVAAVQPGSGQAGTVTYDHSQQQVLFFSASATR